MGGRLVCKGRDCKSRKAEELMDLEAKVSCCWVARPINLNRRSFFQFRQDSPKAEIPRKISDQFPPKLEIPSILLREFPLIINRTSKKLTKNLSPLGLQKNV